MELSDDVGTFPGASRVELVDTRDASGTVEVFVERGPSVMTRRHRTSNFYPWIFFPATSFAPGAPGTTGPYGGAVIAGTSDREPGAGDRILVGEFDVAIWDSRILVDGSRWTRVRGVRPWEIAGTVEWPLSKFVDYASGRSSTDMYVATFEGADALVARFNDRLEPVQSYGAGGVVRLSDPGAAFTRILRMDIDDTDRIHIVGCSLVPDQRFTFDVSYMFYARLSDSGTLETLERIREIETPDETIELVEIAVPPGPNPRVAIGGRLTRPGDRGRWDPGQCVWG